MPGLKCKVKLKIFCIKSMFIFLIEKFINKNMMLSCSLKNKFSAWVLNCFRIFLSPCNYARKIGGGFGYEGEVPLAKGQRCYSGNGLSLHGNIAINVACR